MSSLVGMTLLALLIIYALLAVPLRSYLQPFVIMSAIPFGVIGALLGHLVMGEALVFFSLLGIVALSGVVVNASLVLVDYVNQQRLAGVEVEEAVLRAGAVRFRPILLTSATTFIGLVPLMATRGHLDHDVRAAGDIARLRRAVRDRDHAAAGAGAVPDPGGFSRLEARAAHAPGAWPHGGSRVVNGREPRGSNPMADTAATGATMKPLTLHGRAAT